MPVIRSRLIKRSRPTGPIGLLLQAGLAPDAVARRAWFAWTASRQLGESSGPERRLVAAFSRRLEQLDPSSPVKPGIELLTRQLWVRAQFTIGEAGDAVDRLSSAGITMMVLKGGSIHAEGFADAGRRSLGDIDLLVPAEDLLAATDLLIASGWSSADGDSPAYLRRLAQARLGTNYQRGEHGKIDLHATPFHFVRRDAELEAALWRDARPAHLAGRKVLVPDTENAILISLAHAPISGSAEWALDVATRIADRPVDWQKLVDLACRRGLVPSSLAGLTYLRRALEIPVPDGVLADLGVAPVSAGAWLKYLSNISNRRPRNLAEKAVSRVADLLVQRQGYSVFVKDREEVTVTRPVLLPAWRRSKATLIVDSTLDERHELVVPGGRPGRRLAVRMSVPQPRLSRRIYFDVTADGIAIARLRGRLGPPEGVEKTLTFSFPLPETQASQTSIAIEARPTRFLAPGAAADARAEFAAVPFRMLRAAVL